MVKLTCVYGKEDHVYILPLRVIPPLHGSRPHWHLEAERNLLKKSLNSRNLLDTSMKSELCDINNRRDAVDRIYGFLLKIGSLYQKQK